MTKLLIILVLFIQASALTLEERITHLSEHQAETLCYMHNFGKATDMSWTLSAMAWQESDFGVLTLSRNQQDVGVLQINLTSFKHRYAEQLEVSPISDSGLRYMLMNDIELNAMSGVAELEFWKSVYTKQGKTNWWNVWSSYNRGWAGNDEYAFNIREKIKVLKRHRHLICKGM